MRQVHWTFIEEFPPEHRRRGCPSSRIWEADFVAMRLTIRLGDQESESELRRIDSARWEHRLPPASRQAEVDRSRTGVLGTLPTSLEEHPEPLANAERLLDDSVEWRPLSPGLALSIEVAHQRFAG